MPASELLYFGPFRIDIANEQLWREGHLIPVQARAFAVLRYLVEHAGRLVTRQDLTKVIWPDTVVSAGVLRGYIRTLRDVLGDSAEHPQFIETVARRGYHFLAPVTSTPPLGSHPSGAVSFPVSRPLASPITTPLVGQEAELAQLQRALEKALQGERQVLFITGEAGIGKTTLVERFLHPLTAAHDFWIGRGQCVEHYGAGEAYMPVLQALGRVGQGAGGERLVAFLHQYAPTWLVQLPALLPPHELEAVQRRVASATRERMLREMVDAVEALTAERPLLMWLEDLHWADSSSLDWLMAVAQQGRPARLLVIATYRPADISLGGHPLRAVKQELLAKGQGEEVWMPFLSAEEVYQYLTLRYPQNQFPAACGNAIHVSTDGNPLFMVNVVDELVSQGAIAEVEGQWRLQRDMHDLISSTPESLRQLIGKHVERLDETQRQLLEVASVVGPAFVATTVAAVIGATVEHVEEQCEDLVERGQFLRALEPHRLPGGALTGRYEFLHALYQTVLYERTPAVRRMRLHQRIGSFLEERYGPRAPEIAAELAVHFEQGQELQQAANYFQQAAENVMRRCAHREAVAYQRRALAALQATPNTPERARQELSLQIALGVSLSVTSGFAAPEVEHAYARARTLSQQMEDTPTLGPILYGLWNFFIVRSDFQAARALAAQLLSLANRTSDPAVLLAAHNAHTQTLSVQGMQAPARVHLEQALALYDPQEHHIFAEIYGEDLGVSCQVFGLLLLWQLGYPEQAMHHTQTVRQIAEKMSHPLSQVQALFFGAILHIYLHDSAKVHVLTELFLPLCREHEFSLWLAGGHVLHGWTLVQAGQTKEGIVDIAQGIADWRATGAEIWLPLFRSILVEAYARAGQPIEGLATVEAALLGSNTNGEGFFDAELYRLKGELTLQQFQAQGPTTHVLSSKPQAEGEAETCFLTAVTIAQQQQAKLLELRAVMSLTRLWRQQGKKRKARRLLVEIYGWFTEGFGTKDLQDAKALLDEG